MSKLDHLTRMIYHEKQQQGSMLCAQHALNNLLRKWPIGEILSPPPISQKLRGISIASSRVTMTVTGEQAVVIWTTQVLPDVLVWVVRGFKHISPRIFLGSGTRERVVGVGFEEHWYTLRRFGIGNDEDGHWFDLNSLLAAPKWVGRLYLGMVLQQAEADGYSVFVIRPADSDPSSTIPRTDVDEYAATITEDSLQDPLDDQGREKYNHVEGLEDEDWELQAALHASLGGSVDEPTAQPPQLQRRPIPLPESGPSSGGGSGELTPASQHDSLSPSDPSDPAQLADASRERGRRMLEQMTAEQHQAQQELWREGGRPVRRDEDEEYEELLRRAIAESEALAKAAEEKRAQEGGDEDDDSDNDMDVDVPSATPQLPNFQRERVYDDDDAELQAALKASLEAMPEGWTPPVEQPPSAPSSSSVTTQAPKLQRQPSANDAASISSELSEDESEPPSDQPAQVVDHEEMRKRRLARFGG
ncbi:hypothetical protein V5O48_006233 [Marasmius crinis-equi]|uniref:ubiquitinyl hydrolase 1 n=1 Tax=Marasmius crinis-equi TaxID=585013 RepID=A0ABR3FK49_9AGAR